MKHITAALLLTFLFINSAKAQQNNFKPKDETFYNKFAVSSDIFYNRVIRKIKPFKGSGKLVDATLLLSKYKRLDDWFYSTGVYMDGSGEFNYCLFIALPYSSFDLCDPILKERTDMQLFLYSAFADEKPVMRLQYSISYSDDIDYYGLEIKTTVYAFMISPSTINDFPNLQGVMFVYPVKDKQGKIITYQTNLIKTLKFQEITPAVKTISDVFRIRLL